MTQPILRISGLHKRFGDHHVLQGIDFDVQPGDRVAQAEGDATGLFGAQALADYTAQLARDVTADQVQRVADELRDANLIIRKGHGIYAVTDPFVQTAWRERKALGAGGAPAR